MKIAYCDDEQIYLDCFKDLLKKTMQPLGIEYQLFSYLSGSDFLAGAKEFDFVFLDYEMPEMTGFQVAQKYNKQHPHTKIVFLTSHEEVVFDAFRYKAFRYLRKPVSDTLLEECILEGRRELAKGVLLLDSRENGVQRVMIPNIVAILTENRKTLLYTTDNKVLNTNQPVAFFKKRLSAHQNFMLCNKGILINLDCIKEMKEDDVSFVGIDLTVPVSIRKKGALRKKLKKEG